jgi:hypothetical protein
MNKNLLLEKYIRLILEKEQPKEMKTFGDLKSALNKLVSSGDKKGKFLAAKEFGINLATDAIGLGTAKSVFELLRGLTRIPDAKRPQSFLGNFDLDDYVSKIVDNDIEDEFIKYLVKKINDTDDNKPLKGFNMTTELNNYLKNNYQGRHVKVK